MNGDDRTQLELLRVEMNAKLSALDTKLDTNLGFLSKTLVEMSKRIDDHESRTRSLEKWKFAIPASVVMMLAAFIGGRTF